MLVGMPTTAQPKRLPHAPAALLPALDDFLQDFLPCFKRPESRAALGQYLTGLLTECPHKNQQAIAAILPGATEQQLQGLTTQMKWDEQILNRRRVNKLRALRTEGDGVLLVDDTGFEKQGEHSVGVARQYSGTLGKVGNCQVTVNCHYAERTLAWPVNTRLYLPQVWADDAARRAVSHIPAEVSYQPKYVIALALIAEARAAGLKFACVTADADYGDNPQFLNGLDARGECYVVAVRRTFSVARHRGATAPVQTAEAVLHAEPRSTWQTYRWREGSKGWLKAKVRALRCWRVDGAGQRQPGWLIGERPTRGDGDWAYYWSNFPPRTPLNQMLEYAHRRHWIEQFHEEAKELLGWDHYQGRLWHGFHRHAVLIMLSYSFLVWQEWHHRQQVVHLGRPRQKFSPRPDRRRQSLASVHRQIVDRLRELAMREWVKHHPLDELTK